jgi:hypothetical protein
MASQTYFNIQRNPGYISSAYRPLIFRLTSSVGALELQIKAEIYARNDVTATFTYLATKYQKKYKGTAYFVFDVSNVIQTQLSFDRQITLPAASIITACNNSILEYKVVFTEVYYDSNGFPTEYRSVTSGIFKATNSIWQVEDDHDLNDYIIPGTAGKATSLAFSPAFS